LPLIAAILAGGLALSACAGPGSTSATSGSPTVADKAILVTSFGTSYNDNRDLTIGAVERAIQDANPGYEVRRAFTSQIIIDKLAERDGLQIDNVGQAMDRLVADGVKDLVIQPTTIMAGYEYTDLVTEAMTYQDKFDSFSIGSPLLTTDDDYKAVAAAIAKNTAQYAGDDSAVIFMGHGTSAPSNANYAKIGAVLKDGGYKNYFVGTVEASPSLQDMIQAATEAHVTKVVLQPLMLVAGDHANNDMAGDEADSWKSEFTKAGFEVTTLIEGLGQNPDIQQIYVSHAKAAIAQAAVTPKPTPDQSASGTASTSSTAAPMAAGQIKEGTYAITATSTKSMFKVVDAQLNVESETMTVTMTLSGDGYGKFSLGTADQAAKAVDSFIDFTTDDQGRHVYVVPISRLNQPMAIAAESMKTPGTWYDQTVTFWSDRIPAEAITI
jgi:sirohydrochlorin cobaltochelatase